MSGMDFLECSGLGKWKCVIQLSGIEVRGAIARSFLLVVDARCAPLSLSLFFRG